MGRAVDAANNLANWRLAEDLFRVYLANATDSDPVSDAIPFAWINFTEKTSFTPQLS